MEGLLQGSVTAHVYHNSLENLKVLDCKLGITQQHRPKHMLEQECEMKKAKASGHQCESKAVESSVHKIRSTSAEPEMLEELDGYGGHTCSLSFMPSTEHLQENGGLGIVSIEEAFVSLALMPDVPSIDSLFTILQKCRTTKNIANAMCMHMHICNYGLEAHGALGNYLVPLFADCSSMSDASRTFSRLSYRNESSWTSLIEGYMEYGELQLAFYLFQKMQEDSIHPSLFTLVALVKACTKLKCVEKGREIHTKVATDGFEKNLFLGSTLVYMYTKSGYLEEAQDVLDELPVRNVVLWTTLLAGYVELGLGEAALDCLEEMQAEGISPNAVTFVCSLKSCRMVGAFDKGLQLHAELAKEEFDRDLFVCNTLVDMYAKNGSLIEALEVFDNMASRNIVSWNALIAGYAEHGFFYETLDCLHRLQLEGMSPNAVTYVCILKACSTLRAIDKGQLVHSKIISDGFDEDVSVGVSLVDLYAKCGSFPEARKVFDKLPFHDVVSWTALIAGFAELGYGEEALSSLEEMQLEGLSPDAFTFVSSLKACCSIGDSSNGCRIHAEIARQGFEDDLFIGTTLVDMYAKCGSLAEAHEVFDKLSVQTVDSWNALIVGYTEHGCSEKVVEFLKQMQQEGVSPDAITFVCILKACSCVGTIKRGQEIHIEIIKHGFERDSYVGNMLVVMYGKCGSLREAHDMFDKLSTRDLVAWNALVLGYVEHGLCTETMKLLEQMIIESINPDIVTLVCSVKACGITGAVDWGRELHSEFIKKGFEKDTRVTNPVCAQEVGVYEASGVIVANALIDMYGKCGCMGDAQQVFDALHVKNLVAWNALIAGYTREGKCEAVFYLFEMMLGNGIKPDEITFLSLLNTCSHAGLLEKGQKYFESMSKEYDIRPTHAVQNCMIDLFGRAGQLGEAVMMLKRMPFGPDLVTWSIVLGACHKWGNVEFGRQAFECGVKLDEKHAALYTLMSNIYADANMWEDAEKIEAMRLSVQAQEERGRSGIEVGKSVHGFVAEDLRHTDSKDAYVKVNSVLVKWEERFVLRDLCGKPRKNLLCRHCEKLATVCGLVHTFEGTPLHVVKKKLVCDECHEFMASLSKVELRTVICRDVSGLHVFKDGKCSCRMNDATYAC